MHDLAHRAMTLVVGIGTFVPLAPMTSSCIKVLYSSLGAVECTF